MKDYTLPKYDKPRAWIKDCRELELEWDRILLAKKANEKELQAFLLFQEEANFWPPLSIDDWRSIVSLQKDAETKQKTMSMLSGKTILEENSIPGNTAIVPHDPESSWQLYRNKLINDGFKEETVDSIEQSTKSILRNLNDNTTNCLAVKGLVIGNVQSGKTANMAALMAMAADHGWNMFIVLSGTIDNLRVQTQNRLFKDLNQQGNIRWRCLEHLSKTVDISQKAQSLHFDEHSLERYFTVCLKNSSRLKQLIQWAQIDKNKQSQMKILVIDDEADQAGINTSKLDVKERKRINKLICSLVNGLNEKAEPIDSKFKAMNYIGYTATPYANILNEASEESLYPRNFIATLAVSNEYFGPQQIFGYDGDSVRFDGLDIIRTIDTEQLNAIKEIHDGYNGALPQSLKDAIGWFLCCVACMRIWKYRKPVSMLVHTSQKTWHHENVANAISKWLKSTSKQQIITLAKKVWDSETKEFSFEKFKSQYPTYGRQDEEINRYPSFEELEPQIEVILDAGTSHIKLDDDGDLNYHKGLHLCIDNCLNNGVSDGMHVRLAYPDSENMPDPAPAFIVVGGATLSRGLTIEGLVSTYFLRSVGQADTLMQMGRWFGYRKKYELLPRVWLTAKTIEQFRFLSALDQELRDEIMYMAAVGRSPADYGPKVKNSPKVSFIRITAKNKMQSATESKMDYSGTSSQTYLFKNDLDCLQRNLTLTEQFIMGLGAPWTPEKPSVVSSQAIVWRDITFGKIKSFIESFEFDDRLKVFNDTTPLLSWITKMTEESKLGSWNVVVAGKNESSSGIWTLSNGMKINKISRSRKKEKSESSVDLINIGVLRDPRDLLADIDLDGIADQKTKSEVEEYIKSGSSKAAMAYRDKSGLQTTPQLLIYCIDKDSKPQKTENREPLEAKCDIVGLSLYIPGGKPGTVYSSTVSINMGNKIFDGNPDLEGTDEN